MNNPIQIKPEDLDVLEKQTGIKLKRKSKLKLWIFTPLSGVLFLFFTMAVMLQEIYAAYFIAFIISIIWIYVGIYLIKNEYWPRTRKAKGNPKLEMKEYMRIENERDQIKRNFPKE